MEPRMDLFQLCSLAQTRTDISSRVHRLLLTLESDQLEEQSTATATIATEVASSSSTTPKDQDDLGDDSSLQVGMPPMESVMCIPATARREHFFASVEIGDVLQL